LWWNVIDSLTAAEAKAALLQALADIDEHWEKEHPEDGVPEDLGIPPDEYLRTLVSRIRAAPPPETLGPA
jgi:hypothetical protein